MLQSVTVLGLALSARFENVMSEISHPVSTDRTTPHRRDEPYSSESEKPTSECATPLSKLFSDRYQYLVRFCGMRVRNRADAEDIVQGAFLAARRAYPDKGVDELAPLLMTLVRNRMLDFLKSGDRKRQMATVEIGDVADQLPCGRSPTPEQQVMDQEQLALVDEMMAAMPDRRRRALLMHRIEGLTHTQIALRLSVSRQTVIIDIAEAVAELAEGLARAERRRTSTGG